MEVEERHCGYGACGAPLEYDGRGRPPEYCADRQWPDGRTCKQAAAAERAAGRAAGLDLPLEAFRQAGDRLTTVATPLARQLTELVEAIGRVRDGALARVGEAEQTTRAEIDRARTAEEAVTRAARAQRAAETARDQARAEATQATRRADDARRDAEEQVQRAWQRVAQADHDRGHAEAAAAAAGQALVEQARRREQAESAVADLRGQVTAGQATLATAHQRITAAETQVAALTGELGSAREHTAASARRAEAAQVQVADLTRERERLAGELVRVGEQAQTRLRETEDRLHVAVGERDAARGELAGLAQAARHQQEALTEARQAAESARQRADRAETRLDQLLAAFPAATATPSPS